MKQTVSRYFSIQSPRELFFLQNSEVYFFKFSSRFSKKYKCYIYDITLNVLCTPIYFRDMIIDFDDDIQIFMVRKVHFYGN